MATLDLGKIAIKHKGNWSSATTYEPFDFVYYSTDGCGYIALASSTNVAPGSDATKWALSVHAGSSGASAVKPEITYTSSDTEETGLAWDTVHVFPEMSSLSFTLDDVPEDSVEHQVVVIFDTPSDITEFTFVPDENILWSYGIDLTEHIAASKRYEINISSASMIAVYSEATITSSSES